MVDPAHRIGRPNNFRIATGSDPGRNEGVEPMGRGRAKAKQTKVARELKYSSGGTDLDRLAQELAAERNGAGPSFATTETVSGEEDDDEYAGYSGYDDEDENAS